MDAQQMLDLLLARMEERKADKEKAEADRKTDKEETRAN
jgi:hypothetical protein